MPLPQRSLHILPRAGRAGDWDTEHLASLCLSCSGILCWGFHEQTMTFAKHNDLCRDGQTLATPQQAQIQTELLWLFPTELNHQEERLLKTVTEDFGQVLELLP